jgi:hypothetical protein
MTVGWRQIDGSWYYFKEGGSMATGMSQINGAQYYLNPSDGKMAVSTTFDLNGVSYTADANGVCTVTPQETQGAQTPESQASTDQPTNTGNNQASQAETTAPAQNPSKAVGPGVGLSK